MHGMYKIHTVHDMFIGPIKATYSKVMWIGNVDIVTAQTSQLTSEIFGK